MVLPVTNIKFTFYVSLSVCPSVRSGPKETSTADRQATPDYDDPATGPHHQLYTRLLRYRRRCYPAG